MIRLSVLAGLLLMARICQAVVVVSNGAGGGPWSKPETWATGMVPRDGDAVTILAGDTVTFDVDMSGWESGIAGLTCDGTMNCSTSPGRYYLKTVEDIGGAGRIICGSDETAYPSDCLMTFDFGSKPNSFECERGLVLRLHCTQPAHPVVTLSADAAAGQSELAVDTDVSGDIWTPGKVVRINGVSRSWPDSEERLIGMGGASPGTLTVDVGLANAKASGSEVVLVTRNIRIVGSTDFAVKSMRGGVLGCEISNCTSGVGLSSSCVISGTISRCSYGIYSCASCTIAGVISGCTYGVYSSSACTLSGTVSGCAFGVSSSYGGTISGTISGCGSGVSEVSEYQIGGLISGCNIGAYRASACVISGAVFTGNNYDLRRANSIWAYDTLFGSAVECYEYDTEVTPPWSYVASYHHDGVTDAFKAWTRGGVIESDMGVGPSGYALSYRHICTSSVTPCFRQESITIGPGQTLYVQGKILILDNHTVRAPRLEIIDAAADPLVYPGTTPLASAVIPNPLSRYSWQDVTVSYTNPGKTSKRVWIRCSTQQAGNDIYEVWTARLP
ncbi:MAG TPA: hypothetical protein PLU87_03895 [Sedimentisphaerales bacterium]|nr:hypothetical protein [Sedimentisphaerales bacterium]HRS10262.1 hypothetical protein [Sedimentisphaerales bacterium]HRV46968.1 hypothetical protein [Sedimentisphaerales bacterium]